MIKLLKTRGIYVFALFCITIFSSHSSKELVKFPYKQLGLSKEQAAAHLLSRFTYGAKPGDINKTLAMGLENWFLSQLEGNLTDKQLEQLLLKFDAIHLSNEQVDNQFPRNTLVIRQAIKEGYLNKDSVNTFGYKQKLAAFMQLKGYRPQQELFRQFFNQKILRATYSNNQLQELMTDFWFNHFNVSLSKNQCAAYVPAYERDVIRPNVFGRFNHLLIQTAQAPAMLMYLDNFNSSGTNIPIAQLNKTIDRPRKQGLNENYAREVMELHTMGVDGGYTQSDVTAAAKILTGWTLAPKSELGYGVMNKSVITRIGEARLAERGFVLNGDFLFSMNRHDNSEKTVLGKVYKAGGGYQEGVDLLAFLAKHPSTAKFIATKIAVRFVSDHPPKSLIEKMANTFINQDGDIKAVLLTMVSTPEFWSKEALRNKTKSPFELAISAVRGVDAKINQPYQLYNWVTKMGQQMYYYQAPTGFPDQSQYWINTGSLLNRMNFGLAFAAKKIPGISFDLLALNQNHEPESSEDALSAYSKLMMPARDLETTMARLRPMLNRPSLESVVEQAASEHAKVESDNMPPYTKQKKENLNATVNGMLAQVVGIIIGSPEYQRK